MLTPRQQEIAQMVARGMSYKAIAKETGLSVHTVDNHIRQAAERLPIEGSPRHRLTLFVLNAPDAA